MGSRPGANGSNLQYEVWRNSSGRYALAFKGTEWWSARDWATDIGQALHIPCAQYTEAVDIATTWYNASGGNLEIVGHSLGGGLATVAALSVGVHATVFNPAGVSAGIISDYGGDIRDANQLIKVYRVQGEILTSLQDTIPGLPDTVGDVTTLIAPRSFLGGNALSLHMMSSVIDAINNGSH